MLFCVAHLGRGVPGHQLQYHPAGLLRLARARFTQQLDAGKLFRSFQGTQEIELGCVTGGTNDQLHLDAARVHLRPDADHAHTSRKNALQVHKNLCPGEAALFDKTVEETAAVAHLEDVRAVEELFQVPAFPAESVHPLLQERRDLEQFFNRPDVRSEEHTSELQSRSDLVCRLLLEKKKHNNQTACL